VCSTSVEGPWNWRKRLNNLVCTAISSSQDGRVGLRRQFQVLVRKGMGSNPILDMTFFNQLFILELEMPWRLKLSTGIGSCPQSRASQAPSTTR
jgi:hypothetical protein